MPVRFFTGEFDWLSNFYPADIIVDGHSFVSVEHAYQAFKTDDAVWFRKIREAKNSGTAKRMGKQCPMRHDWEQVKVDVMRKCVRAKFTQNEDLKQKLLATDGILEEGNTWGDRVWGVVGGQGQNLLGKILMEIRDELK